MPAGKRRLLFEGQLLHYAALAILLAAVHACLDWPGVLEGPFLGLDSLHWIWLVVLNAVLHHVYVWFCWRVELHFGLISRWFGVRSFAWFATGFAVLFGARPLMLLALGWANRGTLPLSPMVAYGMATLCFGLAGYTMYSVKRYFSFGRAFGLDHFDVACRRLPLVRSGIFRLSPNAMYVFGFLALWGIALLLLSKAALVMAAFSHLYIWVHYFATERPDMQHIYGD